MDEISEYEPRDKLRSKLERLYNEANDKGIDHEVLCKVFKGKTTVQPKGQKRDRKKHSKLKGLAKGISVTVAVLGVTIAWFIKSNDIKGLNDAREFIIHESPCAISNNGMLMEAARPLLKCDVCRDLSSVPIETNISNETFASKYAYTSVPVLIKNATHNWTAMSTFSFHFIKELYNKLPDALKAVEEDCQFFPYKTEFETLEEALNMTDARARFQEGEKPWYFGWSNCDPAAARKLREHYKKPYFLPAKSESSDLDWIFMGGSGLGAFIHLDYVEKPSWQAQISGMKTWTLVPVPECESVCHSMNVTVHKGDIIVINTNNWYHATYIHPGEISITIGSEYD